MPDFSLSGSVASKHDSWQETLIGRKKFKFYRAGLDDRTKPVMELWESFSCKKNCPKSVEKMIYNFNTKATNTMISYTAKTYIQSRGTANDSEEYKL